MDLTNEMSHELQGYDHWHNFKTSIASSLVVFCAALFVVLVLRNAWAAADAERAQALAEALAVAVLCSATGMLLLHHQFERAIPGVNYGVLASQGFAVSLIVAGWWFQVLATRSIQSDGVAYLILMGEIGASSLLALWLARFIISARALGLSRMRVLLWLTTEALLEYLLVYLLTTRSLLTA